MCQNILVKLGISEKLNCTNDIQMYIYTIMYYYISLMKYYISNGRKSLKLICNL